MKSFESVSATARKAAYQYRETKKLYDAFVKIGREATLKEAAKEATGRDDYYLTFNWCVCRLLAMGAIKITRKVPYFIPKYGYCTTDLEDEKDYIKVYKIYYSVV